MPAVPRSRYGARPCAAPAPQCRAAKPSTAAGRKGSAKPARAPACARAPVSSIAAPPMPARPVRAAAPPGFRRKAGAPPIPAARSCRGDRHPPRLREIAWNYPEITFSAPKSLRFLAFFPLFSNGLRLAVPHSGNPKKRQFSNSGSQPRPGGGIGHNFRSPPGYLQPRNGRECPLLPVGRAAELRILLVFRWFWPSAGCHSSIDQAIAMPMLLGASRRTLSA